MASSETYSPMSSEEYSSLRNALFVMLVASLLAAVPYAFGIQFFAWEFEMGIVFTPTIILLGSWFAVSRRRPAAGVSPA